MLKISRLADYATLIMNVLAEHSQDQLSATQIAAKVSVALPTVRKLLKMLNEAQLVRSLQGANGGYQLTTDPAEISVARIVAAIDGAPALTACNKTISDCQLTPVCQLRHNWQLINKRVASVLESFSLADMSSSIIDSDRGK